MAIIGYPEDLIRNHQLDAKLKTALDYLVSRAAQDAEGLMPDETKRQDIVQDQWALIQNYLTKPDGQFEGHRAHIDVQFIVRGREIIKLTPLNTAKALDDYDADKDLSFYYARSWSSLRLETGMVAILFPEDLHAPGLSITEAEPVTKVVVKIRL